MHPGILCRMLGQTAWHMCDTWCQHAPTRLMPARSWSPPQNLAKLTKSKPGKALLSHVEIVVSWQLRSWRVSAHHPSGCWSQHKGKVGKDWFIKQQHSLRCHTSKALAWSCNSSLLLVHHYQKGVALHLPPLLYQPRHLSDRAVNQISLLMVEY